MIPEGASGGAYVSYAVEELHRAGGARSPATRHGGGRRGPRDGARGRPATDGAGRILRTWVFEFETTETCPLPDPPALALAALETHDLPRFAAYLWGDDVSEREELGVITAAEAVAEQALRSVWRERLLRRLGLAEEQDVAATTAAALEGCLDPPGAAARRPSRWSTSKTSGASENARTCRARGRRRRTGGVGAPARSRSSATDHQRVRSCSGRWPTPGPRDDASARIRRTPSGRWISTCSTRGATAASAARWAPIRCPTGAPRSRSGRRMPPGSASSATSTRGMPALAPSSRCGVDRASGRA